MDMDLTMQERFDELVGRNDQLETALERTRNELHASDANRAQQTTTIESMKLELGETREQLRRALGIARTVEENLTATQKRCTELREALLATRTIELLREENPDAHETLIWQLVHLGEACRRSMETNGMRVTNNDIALGVVVLTAAEQKSDEEHVRKLALEIAATALRRSMGE